MIYFDNAASTPVYDAVNDVITESLRLCLGNPSSMHKLGTGTRKCISDARIQISDLMKCKDKEIVFTSCATESINMVLKCFWDAYPRVPFEIITSSAEHKATLECCSYLERKGAKVIYLPTEPDGTVSSEKLKSALTSNTSLLTFLHVNNETGAINNIAEFVNVKNMICPNAKVHIDAVQSFGKIDFYPSKLGVDYASISAHKINGPKGIGALYCNENVKIQPLIHGGGQENFFRSGTENVSAIVGFGKAAEISAKSMKDNLLKISKLKEIFIKELINCGIDFIINSPETGSPYILNLSFPGYLPEILLHSLEVEDLFISTASACSSRNKKISHVLTAMGISDKVAKYAVRLSFGATNSVDEVYPASRIICESLNKIPKSRNI